MLCTVYIYLFPYVNKNKHLLPTDAGVHSFRRFWVSPTVILWKQDLDLPSSSEIRGRDFPSGCTTWDYCESNIEPEKDGYDGLLTILF
jgi:hypothetical protein